MNPNSFTHAFIKALRRILIVGLATTGGSAWAGPTVSIVDTLGAATPVTQFSVFGSGGQAIFSSQFPGPEFTLTGDTVLTEIGGFVNNCGSIVSGVPQCPATVPFTVQIRPSTNGMPDASVVLASFTLSHDNDPLVISYESAAINLTLGPGSYFALFAPQGNDAGFLLGTASVPFLYEAGLVNLGFLDPTTGSSLAGLNFGAVRILGHTVDSKLSIIDLGTLGGARSEAFGINERGQVVGFSDTSVRGERHAVLWKSGVITDLGTLGGIRSEARGINERGQVVGQSQTASGEFHAFLWERGVMIDLGTLGGTNSFAFAISKRGQVLGHSETASGEVHSFLWERGGMTDLGTLGGTFSFATAINERGQVVGQSQTASGEFHAFLWERGVMTDLGGTNSIASAINERGQIVGNTVTALGETRAFLWQHGVITDLGTLGGTISFPIAINERGQVAGGSYTASGDGHAFLWQKGVMTDLGTLGGAGTFSGPIGINKRGQVAGNSSLVSGDRAFLWQDGVMTNLGTLGGTNSEARAMNERGQVVGVSRTASNQRRAVLWTRDAHNH